MPRTAGFYKSAGKSCATGSTVPVGGRRRWHGSWSIESGRCTMTTYAIEAHGGTAGTPGRRS